MPQYDYKCRACDHAFTVKKGFAEATRKEVCPVCGGEARKDWSATVVRLTCGSGESGGGFG